MEDLIQRYDLFDKKPKESAAEEKRIPVLKVVVGSDGESADEEPQTMGEFVYDDEVEGWKHVRKVTIESADEGSDEEKQDMPRSISRESPRSERSFPASAPGVSRDTSRSNEAQDAQEMPVDKHMSSDKAPHIDVGSKLVEPTDATQRE
ncbi:hypothetical protein ACKAV7_015147 [Fusarium commune]